MSALQQFWNSFTAAALSFTFKDVIDIAIVSFLIYSGIKLVRETRVGQLVKGIILLVVFFLVSFTLQFKMLNEVLRYVLQYGLVALIIIFQPEIRKALEQMGRGNVGKSITGALWSHDKFSDNITTAKAIDSVVEATSYLQQLKMGALIVFERETNLGDIISTGTSIGAEPTAELLGNIFYNKAPLHDGAAVIRGGIIEAAGCILPLTNKNTIDSSLGTRHRAAIGISEDSDAVVVVVSEETGLISVTVGGRIERDYNRITLKETLEGLLLAPEEKKESLGRRIINKFSSKSKEKGADNNE